MVVSMVDGQPEKKRAVSSRMAMMPYFAGLFFKFVFFIIFTSNLIHRLNCLVLAKAYTASIGMLWRRFVKNDSFCD